jgi:hypothetical protein
MSGPVESQACSMQEKNGIEREIVGADTRVPWVTTVGLWAVLVLILGTGAVCKIASPRRSPPRTRASRLLVRRWAP